MKERYVIEIDRPTACSVSMMKEYLRTAIRNWIGGSDPEHPLYHSFDAENSVKISRLDTTAMRETVRQLIKED